jgi:hypothetical protein
MPQNRTVKTGCRDRLQHANFAADLLDEDPPHCFGRGSKEWSRLSHASAKKGQAQTDANYPQIDWNLIGFRF